MLKLLSYSLIAVAIFSTGYQTGATIQDNKWAYSEASLRLMYEKKQDDIIQIKDEAINLLKEQLDEQAIAYSNLKSSADRLQLNLNASNRRLASVSNNTCITERKLLGECQRLLVRGSELLERGTGLLRETATNNDALVRLYGSQPK